MWDAMTAITATIAVPPSVQAPTAAVGAALRAFVARGKEVRLSPLWKQAFAGKRKDHRYYDIVEDTMHPEITHRYLMITDQLSQAGSRSSSRQSTWPRV
jgi:hypothetical protein